MNQFWQFLFNTAVNTPLNFESMGLKSPTNKLVKFKIFKFFKFFFAGHTGW